ncbi:tigger transposable element-derived protein 1-like [Scleropages formosus]|uniref:tigger transposable element-derived protein 1-like n=1 Tax=Scleropages formosus TaxID=113540 RepID=UPI0010FAB856|nr:tigger transposable element-derived protein 1-like [Scleropages formosus]XP_029107882.1 tigger transposable element-derived protein 1-like [Scleropages formosus]XP_029107886.1 tigger transposable element-derived protein 1-like [Scleropages formosus]XP_029107888.1 tigger transposable element-derived protein 1-like [Scleropages formosus]XP_029107891.1 tigger transposable element-derived protein 1-like [Scleropages formosus]
MAEPGPEHPSLALRGLPSESDCFGSMATPYFEGAAVVDMCVKTEPDDKDISHPDYCTEVQGFGAEEMHSGLHLDSDKIKTEIVLVKIMDDNADLQLRSTTEVFRPPLEHSGSSTFPLLGQYPAETGAVKIEQRSSSQKSLCTEKEFNEAAHYGLKEECADLQVPPLRSFSKHWKAEADEVKEHSRLEGSSSTERTVNEVVDDLLQNNSVELESSLIIADDIVAKRALEAPMGPVTAGLTNKARKEPCSGSVTHKAQQWQCLQCRKVYKNLSYLENPLKVGLCDKYCCKQCGVSFSQNCCLKQHQLIHSRQKPYKCSQCGKMFSRQSALKLHHDFHAGKKPFASGSRGDVEKGVKRKRVAHSLKLKLEVLKRLECGERQKDTAIALGLSKSTVNSIYVSREQIKARAQNVLGGDKLTKITRGRHEIYEKLERLLVQWIDSHSDRGIPLTTILIQEKARTLFVDLKNKALKEGDETVSKIKFKGSHGWFERFKKRAMLHNVKIRGDASADSEYATTFPTELQQIIEEGNYTSKQIFNVDETGLFWKRMPTRSVISKIEAQQRGHKASKDRLTLLLGGNLEGDVKLKPLLVYHSETPRALKGVVKHTLPVIWRSNRKAWVTCDLFMDYIKNYFCPFVREYCAKNSLDNKAILVLDNAPGHPFHIEDYGNIHVVFLPPNTTFFLQPMDQGVLNTFKAYYVQLVMEHIVSRADANVTAMDIWRNFTIKQAIETIFTAWSMISKHTMNSAWKNLCPKYVHGFKGFEDDLKCVRKEIVLLAMKAGFEDVDDENVSELLASHNEILSNEELLQLDEERLKEERSDDGGDGNDDDDDDDEPKVWDVKSLRMLFQHHDAMLQVIDEYETDMERGFKVKMMLMQSIEPYKNLYEERRKQAKQSSVTGFLKSREKTAAAQEVLPSTSGYICPSDKAVEEEMDTDD